MSKISKETLLSILVTANFETGRVKKSYKEVLEFKKGTIIKLENSTKDEIKMYINDEPFGAGKALRKDGIMHVEISEILKE